MRPSSIIADVSPLYPLFPPAAWGAHRLPLLLLSPRSTFSNFLYHTSQDDGPYDLLRMLSHSHHVFSTHFFNISFKGACFPLKWYHRHEHDPHSLFRCEESDTDNLPAVGSPGLLRSTIFLFAQNNALQNGPPNGSHQTFTWTTLCNSLMALKTLFRLAPSPTPPFLSP